MSRYTDFRIEADEAAVAEVKAYLIERGIKVIAFRGADVLPLNLTRDRPVRKSPTIRTPFEWPSPAPPTNLTVFHFAVQGEGSLAAAAQALANGGVEAWVAESSREGPRSVPIAEFLRQRGQL